MITVYINIYVPYFDFLPLYLPCISYVHIHLSGANLQGLGEEGGVAVSAKVLIQEIQAKVGRKTWFLHSKSHGTIKKSWI